MSCVTTRMVNSTRISALCFLAVLVGFIGCGLTAQDGSESHFIRCSADSDCVKAGETCVEGYCRDTRDASVLLDGNSSDAFCALNDRLEHVADLESFCAAVASNYRPCPKDRGDLLSTIPSSCGAEPVGSSYPKFWRGCGFDIISTPDYGASAEYYFDSATGVLVGAYRSLGSGALGCMDYPGFWRVGEQAPDCARAAPFCDLCLNEIGCPADIVAKIPTAACTPPADGGSHDAGAAAETGSCLCDTIAPSVSGLACDPNGTCSTCQNGTCTADCVCMRDGTFRYRQTCVLLDGAVW